MTEDVTIRITGKQKMPDGDLNPLELTAPGRYFFRNGHHYLLYEETQEGFEKTTQNRIRISEDRMEIRKKGLASAHMVFEKAGRHVTSYETPFGVMKLGIQTERLDIAETDNAIDVRAEYALETEGGHLADCSIQIRIQPAETSSAAAAGDLV